MNAINVSLVISGVLFALALILFYTRRSFLGGMLSILFIWIGAILNLVVSSHEGIGGLSGQGAVVLLAILAGLETCIALVFRGTRESMPGAGE
jgi:NADH:ubiquinone oxidoreductase subunit K